MYGFALLCLSLCITADGAESANDVIETKFLTFHVQIQVSPEGQKELETLRVFVSVNWGKTWTQFKDCKPSDKEFTYKAPRDDLYWFAVQSVRKDGTVVPRAVADLKPLIKVRVKSAP